MILFQIPLPKIQRKSSCWCYRSTIGPSLVRHRSGTGRLPVVVVLVTTFIGSEIYPVICIHPASLNSTRKIISCARSVIDFLNISKIFSEFRISGRTILLTVVNHQRITPLLDNIFEVIYAMTMRDC